MRGTDTGAAAWVAARGRWSRLALAVLGGALMTAGHAPVAQPWVLFVAVPLLVLLTLAAPGPRSAAWVGWAAGFGYFVTGLHWIGYAFLVDAERFAWLLPLGTAVLPAGLALFWALAFWAARRLGPPGWIGGTLTLAALWTIAEVARGHVLTGLPWALPAYVWTETPVMQVAAWTGPYGLTLLTLVLTALPGLAAVALRGPGQRAGRGQGSGWRPQRLLAIALPLALGAALWVAGAARVPETTAYPPEPTVVRLVQPNAAQRLKWQEDYLLRFYRRAVEATAAPPDPVLGPPDVTIWPETAMFFRPAEYPGEVADLAAKAHGATLIVGAMHRDVVPGGTATFYNSLFVFGPDGVFGPRYDKHHLVPFGEYLPLPELFDAFGLRQFTLQGGFGRGRGPRTLSVPGLPSFSPLICYEAIFPGRVVGATRPDWLVQVTNDAWFGPYAGPQQHLAQARFRAVEQGLPLARAANTGISAVIDPFGRIMVSLPLDSHGSADARLPAPLAPTLYARTGDMPALAGIAALALFGIGLGLRARRA